MDELLVGQFEFVDNCVILGFVLGGIIVIGFYFYLGCYYNQIIVLCEGCEWGMLEYLWMGKEKYFVLNMFILLFNLGKLFLFIIFINGSFWVMVLVGVYEKVMLLDILFIQLLCLFIVGDIQIVQDFGCLELDEDDVVLCFYVCFGKYEYGLIFCDNLE